jgi:hypothetical protein
MCAKITSCKYTESGIGGSRSTALASSSTSSSRSPIPMFPAVVVAGCRHKVVLDAERCTEHVHGDAGGEQKISSVLEAAELRENEGNEGLRHEAAVQIRAPVRHCRIPPRRRLTATAPPGRTPPTAPPPARSMRLRVFAATKRNRVGARRRCSQPPCLQRSSLESPADSPPPPPP